MEKHLKNVMKTDSPKKTKLALKPILIAGDDKGGVGKSTSVAHFGDALELLGYSVRYADGDPANRTLSDMVEAAIAVDGKSDIAIREFVAGSAAGDHDITLLDMAGASGSVLAKVFGDGVRVYEPDGVRVVVALVITEHPGSIKGVMNWISAFLDSASFLVVANGKDSPVDQLFSFDRIDEGDAIIALCEDRIVQVPRIPDHIAALFRANAGRPSDYLLGGRFQALHHFQRFAWQRQLCAVAGSVAKISEWLVGFPPRKPFAGNSPDRQESNEAAQQALSKLKARFTRMP